MTSERKDEIQRHLEDSKTSGQIMNIDGEMVMPLLSYHVPASEIQELLDSVVTNR